LAEPLVHYAELAPPSELGCLSERAKMLQP
jgi:hypothetical protein